jgi:hypothetical protein
MPRNRTTLLSQMLSRHPSHGAEVLSSLLGKKVSPEDAPKLADIPSLVFEATRCLVQDELAQMLNALQENFNSVLENPVQVLNLCSGDHERFGVWLNPTMDATEIAVRQQVLAQFDIVPAGDDFAYQVSADVIGAIVDKQYQTLHARDHTVTGYFYELRLPASIVTKGIVSVPGGTQAQLVVTDHLTALSDQLTVTTDAQLVYWGISGGTSVSSWSNNGGPGQVLVNALPTSVLAPETKTTFLYPFVVGAPNASIKLLGGYAVAFSGTFATRPRAPQMILHAPGEVVVSGTQTHALVNAWVELVDAIAPQITWTANGTITPQGGYSTTIDFDVSAVTPGTAVGYSFIVDVSDMGIALETTATVLIYRMPVGSGVGHPGPAPGPGPGPIRNR